MYLIIGKKPQKSKTEQKNQQQQGKNKTNPPVPHIFMSGKLEAFIVTFYTRKILRDDSGSSEAVS